MQVRDEFYPDIETKFEHLLTHMGDKNKVTEELVKILKEICNLELFYSSSLDKFANSVSKLLIGKDPIKDILIIFERILASKFDESQKLAHEIKDDLIPFLITSLDYPAQQRLKERGPSIRETRATVSIR